MKNLTFDQIRAQIGEWLQGEHGGKLWDLMTCQRGPDSPSERPDQPDKIRAVAYKGRRDRKYKTVEVIRANSWNGAVGGCARSHKGDTVTLPPRSKWDHFDRHVERAAQVIGLKVEIEKEVEPDGVVATIQFKRNQNHL